MIIAITILLAILILSVIPKSFANEESVVIMPNSNSGQGILTALLQIEFDYTANSTIAKALNETNEQYLYFDNITDPNNKIIKSFNTALVSADSTVIVSSANITFRGKIQSDSHSATITYDTEIKPVLHGFVIGRDVSSNSTVIDLNWRKVVVSEPIYLQTDAGAIDINHPISLLSIKHKELADKLNSILLHQSAISFDAFSLPMDKWHYLLDPTFSLPGSDKYRNQTKVFSQYYIGDRGTCLDCNQTAIESNETVKLDGYGIAIHSYVPPPTGRITILGYSSLMQSRGPEELAAVYYEGPRHQIVPSDTDPAFQLTGLLVIAGIGAGAIAIIVVLSRKRNRNSI